ncbi:MAG: PH domain-containing protein [Desulfovibrionaceae bacterium]
MSRSFKVPMSGTVLLLFFLAAALLAGVVAWGFRSGFVWMSICFIAVGLPFAALYWYVLWANPARTRVDVLSEGLHVRVPPFFDLALPWGEVRRFSEESWGPSGRLRVKDAKRSVQFGGYVSGVFELEDGREALVALRRKDRTVCVEADGKVLVLGPSDVDGLLRALESRGAD